MLLLVGRAERGKIALDPLAGRVGEAGAGLVSGTAAALTEPLAPR
jgi:hypothetical protein